MNEWVVLLPTTYGMQERDEKIRTYLIGNIARACTIFNVNRIIIYRDPSDESSDFAGKFIRDVLEYANTTPYLRKYFPKKDTLKYAGVLPPLRAVHHPDINESIEYRYGYVKKITKNGSLVDVGLEQLLFCPKKLTRKILIFKIRDKKCFPVSKSDVPYFFGYDVQLAGKGLKKIIEELKKENYLLLGTSKYGEHLNKVYCEILNEIKNIKKVAIAFGSYSKGFYDWFSKREIQNMFDFMINAVPNQGSKTIRTEEALFIILGILNVLVHNLTAKSIETAAKRGIQSLNKI